MPEKLLRGTQIVYIPPHCARNWDKTFEYPGGAQPGFITSGPTKDGAYFCRYWQLKDGEVVKDLRTKANSELTPRDSIICMDTVDEADVVAALLQYC